MKYTCEICDATFINIKACELHENACKCRNQRAIDMATELNRMVTNARHEDIKLGVASRGINGERQLIPFEKVYFNVRCRAVIVELADDYVELDEVEI